MDKQSQRVVGTRPVITALTVLVFFSTTLGQIWSSIGQKNRSEDMGQLLMLSKAFGAYTQDYDNLLPLGVPRTSDGVYYSSFESYVPADWPVGAGGDPLYPVRKDFSRSYWATPLLDYSGGRYSYRSPGTPQVETSASKAQRGGPRDPALVTYTYPGTLTQWNVNAVATPSKFPLLWQGAGNAANDGATVSNPALKCLDSHKPCVYVPTHSGCSTGNGEQSSLFTPLGSMWVYDKTATWLTVDGSATHRPLGASHTTDPQVDPYTDYDEKGFPSSYWFDGCHALLFRPDKQY